ncbi:adenylate kinase [Nonomuraea basaltis]|nr:adenylate kinase [Nonomuraea basaltis]
MRLVLLGPPGAGKGTQGTMLSSTLGVPHISTGVLLRHHVDQGTPLGREAKHYVDAGTLVPDHLTVGMLAQRLAAPDTERGFLLDGFPRTVAQAKSLSEILEANGLALHAALELQVSEENLIARLLGRGRADDTEAIIRKRQRIYRSHTTPLLSYYADILVSVHAVGSVEEVADRVSKALRVDAVDLARCAGGGEHRPRGAGIFAEAYQSDLAQHRQAS